MDQRYTSANLNTLRRMLRPAIFLVGLVLIHGVPAREAGPYQPMCDLITSAVPPPLMTGTFDTTFGQMTLTPTGGTFTASNGQLRAVTTQCRTMTGIWVQDKSAHQCPNGKFYGKFQFVFTSKQFTGVYGYCDGPITAGTWNGNRLW